ncbi:MAG: SH3 domain-containing protein [Deltaproteobacteria bacterium]|uniref:SH3 domain-containing protein n=1 Tax=Candidatus Zymogenus saltonus TaxID=2844893 RepID=A0A9D8PPM1_9DELT|nr:SH3 domain-containing protein [Candidatus Zymogenus saltonus]
MKKTLYLLAAACLIIVFALPATAVENATITGDGLRVREKPTLDGRKLGTVNKGYRVEALAHSNRTDSIDGFTGYWYYIVYKDLSGWVFGKYIQVDIAAPVPSESEFTPPKPTGTKAVLKDILGNWPMYFDTPNIIYSFYNDGKAKFVTSYFEEGTDRVIKRPEVWGSYVFDGKTIQVNWNDGTSSVFYVKKEYGVTSLTVDGKLLPPELHMLGPGETLEYD